MMRYKKLYKHLAPLLEKGDFFVNLGANDGITNDSIYDFIEPFQMKGIAVEPIDAAYQKLCANYSRFSDVICERAAIYQGKILPIYRLQDEILAEHPVLTQASGMDMQRIVAGLEIFRSGNFDSSLYKKIHRDAIDHSVAIENLLVVDENVVYMTFEELMEKYKVKKIDFLDIDIEGYDFDVFMSIDFLQWRPKVMIIETKPFTSEQTVIFSRKIKESGYKFLQNFDYYSEVFIQC